MFLDYIKLERECLSLLLMLYLLVRNYGYDKCKINWHNDLFIIKLAINNLFNEKKLKILRCKISSSTITTALYMEIVCPCITPYKEMLTCAYLHQTLYLEYFHTQQNYYFDWENPKTARLIICGAHIRIKPYIWNFSTHNKTITLIEKNPKTARLLTCAS